LRNVEENLEILSSLVDGNQGEMHFAHASGRTSRYGQNRPFSSTQPHANLDRNSLDRRVSVSGNDPPDPLADEDSTDGMGAIVFTDEEDSSFFGMCYHTCQAKISVMV